MERRRIDKKDVTRLAVYVRVSSEEQKEGKNVESQEEVLLPFVERQGWEYTLYKDDGISGHTINKRPEFIKLLEELEADTCPYHALVVTEPDRIGRFGRRLDRTRFMEAVEASLWVLCYDEEDGETGYDGWNEDQMDELEKELTAARKANRIHSRRVRRGLKRVMSAGHYGAGNIPYGIEWDGEAKLWHDKPEETEVLQLIFDLIKQGKGLDTVAKVLNEKAIPTKMGVNKRTGQPRKWWAPTLWAMVQNNFYFTGVLQTKYGPINTGIKLFAKIVVKDARLRVSQRRKEKTGVTRTWNFLLRDLMVCEVCGWKVSVQGFFNKDKQSNMHPRQYYRCKKCKAGLNATRVDAKIWADYYDRVTDPEAFKQAILDEQFITESKRRDFGEQKAQAQADLKFIDKKLAVAKEMRAELELNKEEYFARKTKLDAERQEAQARLSTAQGALLDPDDIMRLARQSVKAQLKGLERLELLQKVRDLRDTPREAFKYAKRLRLEHYKDPEKFTAEVEQLVFEQKREILRQYVLRGGKIFLRRGQDTGKLSVVLNGKVMVFNNNKVGCTVNG